MKSTPGECCWRMIFFSFFAKRNRQENRKFSSSVEGANRPGRKTGDAQRSFYFPKGKEGVHFRFELDIWQDFSTDSHGLWSLSAWTQQDAEMCGTV